MKIPVYAGNEIVSVEEFKPNLNIGHSPSYVNEGGNLGLCRVSSGRYEGCLALLYQDDWYPSCNRGKLISDHDAWELCHSRGKVHLIEQLHIDWNVGIIGGKAYEEQLQEM